MFTDPFHCAFRDRKLQPNYCLSLVTLTGLQTCLLPAEEKQRLTSPDIWTVATSKA